MPSAMDVARHLLYLAGREPEAELVTHLRVQKLLYYVQGWSLALRHAPLFPEPVEAWRNGPVVRSVYAWFADFNDAPIPPDHAAENLSGEAAELVQSVWEHYRQFSASELWRKTHREPPWNEARDGLPPEARSDKPIAHESMLRFFDEQRRRLEVPGLENETLEQAERNRAAGRLISSDDFLASLRNAV